jgi:hypothetical protein
MGLPTKKSKLNPAHRYYDLTEAVGKYQDFFEQLQAKLSEGLLPDPAVQPFLESINQNVSTFSTDHVGPSFQASRLSLQAAASYVGIDFKDGYEGYTWSLKEEECKWSTQKPMSDWAGMSTLLGLREIS